MKIFFLYGITCVLLLMSSCDDDESLTHGETGQLKIEFDNRAGEEDLELNTDYINSNGETFRVSKLNYYISNIILRQIRTGIVVPQIPVTL